MTQDHPITPPPELVEQWSTEANRQDCVSYTKSIAIDAAQWGADKELEACCEWLKKNTDYHITIEFLRDARRPKPPSLKEEALLVIDTAVNDYRMSSDAASIIRRALEALDD